MPVGEIFIENAVKDDRGKFIAANKKAIYYGHKEFLGTYLDKWSYRVGDIVELDHIVLNQKSKKVKTEVDVSIIIPVFNKLEFTQKCLESIYQNTDV